MSHHPIVHIELSSRDRVESANFYESLFGWKSEQMPEMNYATFAAEGGPGGGYNPVGEHNPTGTVMVYVDTDDVDATLKKVVALGGKVVSPKMEIPGVGWFAEFKDLSGNTLAVLQPLPGMPGA